MEPDNLADFRAAHPSVTEALEKCSRPDWALRLAFDASQDRKSVIRQGVKAAHVLSDSNLLLTFITPRPGPLEALDVWSENANGVSRATDFGRASVLSLLVAGPVTYLIDREVTSGWFTSYGARAMVFQVTLVVLVLLIGTIIRAMIARAVHRQVARLDEQTALEQVLVIIDTEGKKRPMRVVRAMRYLRMNLVKFVDGATP